MEKLIEIKELSKEFPIKKGFLNKKVGAVHAVNNINIDIYKGETLGLVGESGCGKSTAGRCILKLIEPTKGEIKFKNRNIAFFNSIELKKLRKKMQIIFQNPYSSLNPKMTVYETLQEPLIIQKTIPKKNIKKEIERFIDLVGLSSNILNRYPHEFSGGQRQRIGIARALILSPEFIVADEPVSALDVSIQAQIINLLQDLKNEFNLTYLFISHDLNVVKYISNRVAVMYLGEIVELAASDSLFKKSLHPYSQALIKSVPVADPDSNTGSRFLLKGDLPNPVNLPSGCKFHTRCNYVMDICLNKHPDLADQGNGHFVRCFLYKNKG